MKTSKAQGGRSKVLLRVRDPMHGPNGGVPDTRKFFTES
jgi:hypothetical protein